MHYYDSIDKQKMTLETVRFLGIITGSKRLVNLVEKKKEEEHKEDNEVCLAIEEMCTQQYEKGCNAGRSEGIELGRSVELFTNVNNLMDSLNYSREQAMDALKVSEEDRAILAEKFGEINQ